MTERNADHALSPTGQSRTLTARWLMPGFGVVLACLLIILGLAYDNTFEVVRVERQINVTNQFIHLIRSEKSAFNEAVLSAHNFVITGNAAFNESFLRNRNQFLQEVTELEKLGVEFPKIKDELSSLRSCCEATLSECSRSIVVRKEEGFAASGAYFQENDRIQHAQQCRAKFDRVTNYFHTLLSQQVDRSAEEEGKAGLIVAALGIAVVSFYCALVLKMYQEALQRQKHTVELETLNEELAVARDKALESARVKSELLANISHELRTPMSGIVGLSDLLSDQAHDEDSRALAGGICDSARDYLKVLDNILMFSSLHAGESITAPIEGELGDVIEEAVAQIKPAAERKGLVVDSEICPTPDRQFLVDRHAMSEILKQLLDNAVKFTERGHISVQSELRDSDNGKIARVTVRDSGIGIDGSRLANIFEPFVQADGSSTRQYGGIGLGLAICSNLAEQLHGQVAVLESTPEGTLFELTVPVRPAPLSAGNDKSVTVTMS